MTNRVFILLLVVILISSHMCECRRRRMSGRMGGGRGSGIGQGFAKMAQSFKEDGTDQSNTFSGSKTKADLNSRKLHQQLMSEDTLLVVFMSLAVVIVVVVVLYLNSNSQAGINHSVENRQRRAQEAAAEAITKAIALHGVHPARARGDIYRIKL